MLEGVVPQSGTTQTMLYLIQLTEETIPIHPQDFITAHSRLDVMIKQTANLQCFKGSLVGKVPILHASITQYIMVTLW